MEGDSHAASLRLASHACTGRLERHDPARFERQELEQLGPPRDDLAERPAVPFVAPEEPARLRLHVLVADGDEALALERAGRDDGGPETVRLNSVRYERETLRIPIAELRESTGSFVFYAGREARPGEKPWSDGDTTFRP